MTAKELSQLEQHAKKIISDYLAQKRNTINSLSVDSGIHPSQISLFLNNKRGLTIATLQKIGLTISKDSKK